MILRHFFTPKCLHLGAVSTDSAFISLAGGFCVNRIASHTTTARIPARGELVRSWGDNSGMQTGVAIDIHQLRTMTTFRTRFYMPNAIEIEFSSGMVGGGIVRASRDWDVVGIISTGIGNNRVIISSAVEINRALGLTMHYMCYC